LQGGGPVLEELGLPIVDQGWLDLMFVAKIGDGDAIDQVPTQNGDLFVRRVVFAGLSHGTDSSRFVVYIDTAVCPFSLGAEQVQIGRDKLTVSGDFAIGGDAAVFMIADLVDLCGTVAISEPRFVVFPMICQHRSTVRDQLSERA